MLAMRIFFKLLYKDANKVLLNAAKDSTAESFERMKQAITNGANINILDVRLEGELNWIGCHYTPLMWAVHTGQFEKVKYLLEKAADIEIKTLRGNTILHIAARGGHLDIYHYLADRFPHLLTMAGEDGLLPEAIAQKYGQEKVMDASETFYSNPYFNSVKKAVPIELVMGIANEISDTVSLNNLSVVNKAWYQLFQDNTMKKICEKSLRQHLPAYLRNKNWADILKYFYPSLTKQITALKSPEEAYSLFIEKVQTFYLIGQPLKCYQLKPLITRAIESFDFWGRPSRFKSIKTNNNDVRRSYRNTLSEEQTTIYKNFEDAAKAEFLALPRPDDVSKYPSDRCVYGSHEGRSHRLEWIDQTFRCPIFEIRVNPRVALTYLDKQDTSFTVLAKDIIETKRWIIQPVRASLDVNKDLFVKPNFK